MNDDDYVDYSDSNSEPLFDTPAARKSKPNPNADATPAGEDAARTRTKESHYTTEEAREAALRRELESVRNVNNVIEGVVESLEKAKNNMDVRRLSPTLVCRLPISILTLKSYRQSRAPYIMPRRYSRRGHAFSPRQSTISV